MPTHRNILLKEKRSEFFIIEKNLSCHITIEVFFKCDLLSLFIFSYFRRKTTRCNLSFKNLWQIIFQSNFGVTSEMLFLLFSKILLESHFLMKQKRTIFASNQSMERMKSLFYKKYKVGLRKNWIISSIKFRHNDFAKK